MLIFSLRAFFSLVKYSNLEAFLNLVKFHEICVFVPDDSVARSSSMPPLPSSGSDTPGKRLRRSNTEMRRKAKNDDDASIRYVGEPRLSNRRKVSPSSTPIFLLQILSSLLFINVLYPCQLI